MKFPLFNAINATRLVVLIMTATVFSLAVAAQKSSGGGAVPEAVGFRLEQCANGKRQIPQTLDPCDANNDWITGIVNESKAHYKEGDSVPYRLIIDGLTPNVPTYVTFSWDTTKGGKHAIDYITGYDRTENTANSSQAIPCAGLGLAICPVGDLDGSDQFQIPADPNYSGATPAPNFPQDTAGEFITIWGGDITGLGRRTACGNDTPIPDNVNPYLVCGPYAGTSVTDITIFFTPTTSDVVLSWGGHIARRADWGLDNGASSISGAPFHTGMITGGSRDVQMSLNAVLFPGLLKIVKVVQTLDGIPFGTASTFQFNFTSSANSGLGSFFLVDDDGFPGVDNVTNSDITSFYVNTTASEILVQEALHTNWTLLGISCDEVPGGSQLPQTDDSGQHPDLVLFPRTARIRLQEGEFVTCTFTNSQLAPTAAPASVGGRVIDSFGNGISGARLTLTDAQTGSVLSVISNPFGYYTIEGAEVGNFYTLTVAHKRYTFVADTRAFSLNGDLVDLDFEANP